MSEELVCPFCNKPLQPTYRSVDEYWCENDDCTGSSWKFGSISLWKELIRTRKALDVAKERLKNTILDAEVLATPEYLASRAKETLDEITAILENKNGNC